MENKLAVFESGDFTARTFTDEDGTIWVVAKDVAQSLGYNLDGGMTKYFAHVPEIWKGGKRISTPGGEQEMLCLTEQGLYFFLGRSDKKAALPYQMWVAGKVIPSIRKTGEYSIKQEQKNTTVIIEDDEFEPKLKYLSRGMFRVASKIYENVFNGENEINEAEAKKVLALDRVFEAATGASALEIAGIKLNKDCVKRSRTVTLLNGEELPLTDYKEIYKWTDNLLPDYSSEDSTFQF